MVTEASLTKAELAKREDIIKSMKGNKRKLVQKYGADAEKVMYGRATNIAKKVAENTMETDKLKEAVKAALMNEKKKPFPDLTGDGKVTQSDILKGRGVELDEDLDLGHEDNEPHMVKADLYKIGKYAMELYQMVDQFEGQGEVDFPAWWQSKITKACVMISSAKHYLEFELKEPTIDAMVDVAQNTGAIDEIKAKVLARLTKK